MGKTQMKIAVVQMSSGDDKAVNLEKAAALIRKAAAQGAECVLLPESFLYRGQDACFPQIAEMIDGPSVKRCRGLAKDYGLYVLLGSIFEKVPGRKKVYNTAVMIGPKGRVLGAYRKQHLFEARASGTIIREADFLMAGKTQKVFSVAGFRAGTAICYDLRFPDVFALYAAKGCHLFFVPSNFTDETGRAHWEVLLRARAIENRCYVLAPNQHGIGALGVRAHGNSMIIDPWGNILKRAGARGDEILVCSIDQKEIDRARTRLPYNKTRRRCS